jgi:glycosyltransferase involved in cell wall biosynthesis
MKEGWLINDCLTCIPGTKTFWHDLLSWFPNLVDKTNGYTDYNILANKIENNLNSIDKKPNYIIRNGTYFRNINTDIKTISLIQDILQNKNDQINVINNSDYVVFNTNYVYEKYKNYIGNKPKIKIIPLGINFDFFKPIKEKHSDVLPNSIVYIGSSLNYPKGFNKLLEIIEMTEYNFCLIMKDNFLLSDLSTRLHNRVKIFNRVDMDTVRLLINSCICAICTSVEETQHLSGIECGACNLPIIGSDVGFYYDCKNDNQWGFVANDKHDFCFKINFVINNLNLFSPREYLIKKYSTEVCKNNWLKIINNI